MFEYDVFGNPTTYRGKTTTWAYGRQLTAYDGNTFTYDARGRRIGKNGITFTYDSNGNLIKQSNGLEFFYDHTGVFAVKHNNTTYFYRKDAQANIVALLDNNGSVVVKYKYDAWGKCVVDASTTNTELANLNPFRYRSYYFDTETGFYFLKTRYYDPEIGRFMTIDDISYLDPDSINGINLYAYCGNNPINRLDYSGHAWYHWVIGAAILVTCAALTVITAGGFAAAGTALASVVSTTMAPTALSAVFAGATIGAAAIGTAGMVIGGMSGEDGWSWESASQGFMAGSIAGAVIGGAWGGAHFALQSAGKMAIRTNINDLVNNPFDEFATIDPYDKAISHWTKMLSQNPRGYNTIPNLNGEVEAIRIIKGTNKILANGHHRVYVMKYIINNAPKYIKLFLTK